jgi:hypothetical protein
VVYPGHVQQTTLKRLSTKGHTTFKLRTSASDAGRPALAMGLAGCEPELLQGGAASISMGAAPPPRPPRNESGTA